ncbi:MAG: methionyl-tRNA formyltransferase [Desulfovibrionaceae bacterium]|nr:methionyl-tRNA formyltransferase [Desulfovibrionaceae bacterium]
MRVVIVGQQWLGAQALKLCLDRGDDIALALAPAAGDSEEYDRLHAAAMQARVPAQVCPRRVEAAHIPSGVDLIVAAHAHAFIATSARQAARYGALGYHPSLLPRHRGRDAVRWAIHMGDPITGGTAYWMDDGADTGPIAAQDWCWIRPSDTPQTLWRRELAPMGLRLLAAVLGELDAGHIPSRPQDDTLATWEPAFSSKLLSGS